MKREENKWFQGYEIPVQAKKIYFKFSREGSVFLHVHFNVCCPHRAFCICSTQLPN